MVRLTVKRRTEQLLLESVKEGFCHFSLLGAGQISSGSPFCRINAAFHLATERRIYAAAKNSSCALHFFARVHLTVSWSAVGPRLYAFSEGGAGDPPAPPGDPPGGMAVTCGCDKTAPFRSMPLPIPSGGSPDGTGESPVLPTLNRYCPKDQPQQVRVPKVAE